MSQPNHAVAEAYLSAGTAGDLPVSLLENSYVNGETIRLDGAIRMPPR